MNKVLSRTLELDTQQCVKNVGNNKYDLVLIASARARELSRQNREDPNLITKGSVISALLEIQQGLVGREYLLKVKK
jgi:DNA-directed RNA polymerase omega subunit